ncbi:MAG: hypothetical protein R2748_19835 [Bryobacterales bacterium]
MVGQQFINQLRNHPYFELTFLGASARRVNATPGRPTGCRIHLRGRHREHDGARSRSWCGRA